MVLYRFGCRGAPVSVRRIQSCTHIRVRIRIRICLLELLAGVFGVRISGAFEDLRRGLLEAEADGEA